MMADTPLLSMPPALSIISWKRLPLPKIFATFAILVLLLHIRTTSFDSFPTSRANHPIYSRMLEANSTYHGMLNRQSKTLGQARREYAKRYHLYPPEGFEKWFAYAREQKSLIIDDFDVINERMEPFRDYFRSGCGMELLDPHMLGANMLLQICVKDGILTFNSAKQAEWIRVAFEEMISPFVKDLPDLCFLMNLLDEPRIILPNDRIPQAPEDTFCHNPSFISFDKQRWWSEAVLPCSPRSPARLHPGADVSKQGQLLLDFHSASDLCQHSSPIKHGVFISPSSLLVSHDLVPIASNAALSTFSDIFFPSIWRFDLYDEYNRTQDIPWKAKKNDGYWRGATTGGEAKSENWKDFQRHRFVDFVNHEENGLANKTDVSFSNIAQSDGEARKSIEEHFHISGKQPFNEIWKHKIVFDIDGNGLSGRFYPLLRSNSAVFRQAIFREWHDARIFPWLHYVPMNMDLTDLKELVDFFLGDGEVLLEKIAEEGSLMAETVLRREDMRVYMYRLLIEMGRKH